MKRKSNLDQIKSQMKTVKTEVKDGIFVYSGKLSIFDLAKKINKNPNDLIKYFFKNGHMININTILTDEQIAEVCIEFGLDFQKEKQIDATNVMDEIKIKDLEEDMQFRPPIITIMGHVDHGKTTLLDYIRSSKSASQEFGGITQHTGAYQITNNDFTITFLDTPGHEAFSFMRSRGAKLTDIVILVVAADDGVMPQTIEAINHAKSANVPIIVFVNKMDKENINVDNIKNKISEQGLVPDEWGGDVLFVYGSALTGMGIDDLFNAIKLQSELIELKANQKRLGMGVVVESKVDKGIGITTTLIILNGTLFPKDFIVVGSSYGYIRTLKDTNNKIIKKGTPSMPVVISGLNNFPKPGDKFFAFRDEKFAKKIANEKSSSDRIDELNSRQKSNSDSKNINIIIKSDVFGTSEAIKFSVQKIDSNDGKINIVHSSIGDISKSDVLLATTSNSIIFAFNTRVSKDIKELAKHENVTIKKFSIIYNVIEEIEKILKGLEEPKYEEKIIGHAQVIKVIFSSKVGNIAGSKIIDGFITSKCHIRVFRKNKVIFEDKIETLQQQKDKVSKIGLGQECGIKIKNFNDVETDDVFEAYEYVRIN